MDITTIACFHFDPENLNWEGSTRSFEYADVFYVHRGTFFSKDRFEVESMFETQMGLLALNVLYGLMAWYFDNVLPANRGVSQDWLFFV